MSLRSRASVAPLLLDLVDDLSLSSWSRSRREFIYQKERETYTYRILYSRISFRCKTRGCDAVGRSPFWASRKGGGRVTAEC